MKLGVCGAAGRMGRRVIALGHEHANVDVVGAVESPGHDLLGKDSGEVAGIGSIGVPITSDVDEVLNYADVLVDFSAPSVSVANVKAVSGSNKAIVVGTTGFSEDQRQEIVLFGAKTRCLVAPNMSLGVNLLFKLVSQAARVLGDDYDVEIIEAHHNMKKDAPSGTAHKLADEIAHALSRDAAKVGVYGRKGLIGQRTREEIGVMAVRGGDIVGEHTVMFVTGGERLELIHRAHSRDALARGAVQAAIWVVSQPAGLYDMQDMLGLKDHS
jgi:4-hydroxy-tetrahydrodipicolinate reductase